jgi:hypothetical protein
MDQKEIKTLERRAKAMLLSRDIPAGKMKVVRALLHNDSVGTVEKYSAIIDLIQQYPEKKTSDRPHGKVHVRHDSAVGAGVLFDAGMAEPFGPELSPVNVNMLHRKYRHLKLFRKRYLIHSSNRLGIGIKKRLIPTRRLFRVFQDIETFQARILKRLPSLLHDIVRDEDIKDPVYFNYLRVFSGWMEQLPFSGYSYDSMKWIDRRLFEEALESYCKYYFSFQLLDVETRERMIQLLEQKLRESDDLKKLAPGSTEGKSGKKNLEVEKYVHEYTGIIRSFLPFTAEETSALSRHLSSNYGIGSLGQLIITMLEALVFQKTVTYDQVVQYFRAAPPRVSAEEWDYSLDVLKKMGKDLESRKQQYIRSLRADVEQYEEIYQLLHYENEGRSMLAYGFEAQRYMVDKRQADYNETYNRDFFSVLDVCSNFFNNSYAPLLDGTTVFFESHSSSQHEGMIFVPESFSNDMKNLDALLRDMHVYRTNNPNFSMNREELIHSLKQRKRSVNPLEHFMTITGDLFYRVGSRLHRLYSLHRRWVLHGSPMDDAHTIRKPLDITELGTQNMESGRPIPFYDCVIIGFQKARPLSKSLIRKPILDNSLYGGIYVQMASFCAQMAYECLNDGIYSDLDERNRILREIRDISG